MRFVPRFALLCTLAAAAPIVAIACGEDEALVRPRLDGGSSSGDTDGSLPEGGTLACGEVIPETYESPSFATNAAVELAFASYMKQIDDKMASAEGESTTLVTAAELKDLFSQGTPSLRAVSTPGTQSLVDGYFDAFGAAGGNTWAPADAEEDGGAPSGGKYDQTFYFSATGLDLREAVDKTILGGVLYNHVLGIVAAQITSEATIDRLLAAFGATTALASLPAADGGVDGDRLIAAHASRRDGALGTEAQGPYRQIKKALLTMKAAVPAGERCKADLDAAVETYLLEWERTTYASAIAHLHAAATAAADPARGPEALREYGRAVGFIQSFRGLPRRKITDAQIDALLTKIGVTTAHKLVTSPGTRVLALNEAISDIALYEGFTPTEVESFRK